MNGESSTSQPQDSRARRTLIPKKKKEKNSRSSDTCTASRALRRQTGAKTTAQPVPPPNGAEREGAETPAPRSSTQSAVLLSSRSSNLLQCKTAFPPRHQARALRKKRSNRRYKSQGNFSALCLGCINDFPTRN